MVLLLLLATAPAWGAAPPAGTAAPTPATTPAPTPTPAPAVVTQFLKQLPYPGPEPRLRWEWDPIAFEPLAHPVPRDFGWRFRELRKPKLPAVARARLDLELAFLDASVEPAPGRRTSHPDSLGAEARARLARREYGLLLAGSPGQAEFLTDLADLYRFLGEPDSAIVLYRQARSSAHVPPRLFSRLLNAEFELLDANPDSAAAAAFQETRSAGRRFFDQPAPRDSLRAARFLLDKARFRIDSAILETRADQRLRPDLWKNAGADSLFSLLARIVAPETRKILAQATEIDTSLAEAYGLLGSVVTGQIVLPISARSLLMRDQEVPADTLALALWALARQRYDQRAEDVKYAAANLNQCEALEPGRYPRVRVEEARLDLLLGNFDGSSGFWRALLTGDPGRGDYAEELYSVYRIEAAAEKAAAEAAAEKAADKAAAEAPEKTPGKAPGKTPGQTAAARLETDLGPLADRWSRAETLALLGWVAGSQGRVAEAAARFEWAARVDSTCWRGRLGAAVAALRRLDTGAAESHLRFVGKNFTAIDGVGRGVYCTAVGLLLWARGDTANAGQWLFDAGRFDPRNPVTLAAYAALRRNPNAQ